MDPVGTLSIDITAFHFLRPLWLLLIPGGLLIVLLWRIASDQRRRWRDLVAPHLLNRLMVSDTSGWRIRPTYLLAASLCIIGLAAAGPTWEQVPPPFSDDKAPLVVALDLSRSMDATDIAPTRLERSKHKIRDLMKLRAGSRTGLVVYAGSAHMVLPPAEDPALMEIYLEALSTYLMPTAGKNALAALNEAEHLLSKENVPGTIVFMTDGFDVGQIGDFDKHNDTSKNQVLVLAVGTEAGGPVRTPDGRVALDASGRPVQGRFDAAALKRLASEADVPLASITLDDKDVEWVQRRALNHMEDVQAKNAEVRWREFGYYLCFPIALLAALWFRRGWVVRWAAGVLLAVTIALPQQSEAADTARDAAAAGALQAGKVVSEKIGAEKQAVAKLASGEFSAAKQWLVDAFLTPDQQGRWHFEHGNYKAAAAHFRDPMWQGQAYYRAGDYAAALTAFARLDTPDAFFMMGNCYAQLKDYPHAIGAYDNALQARKVFPEATANRELVTSLIPKKKKDDEGDEEGPNLKPDDIKFDDKGDKGKQGKQIVAMQKQNAELWMRNLKVSPVDFLRQKFQVEAARARKPEGGAR
ncbi:VWA domain-containing protein [Uliginosibacterium sp. H3]|uniref:VWA domain-containing protein n=1 Tax=Uliginosibacterium silvisoli TaxID=3114758 RepID=A0ABU6K1Y3_9RHOO|nr:VWA domain-containing protein [Uliginosibacterium sp. H3]